MLSDGRRQIFGFVLPGDPIGLCANDQSHALCATVAITDVIVTPLPALAAAAHRHEDSALGRWVQDMMARDNHGLYDQVMRLGRQSAYERLVHQLLDFYYRLRAVGLIEDHSFTLPFTQEVLSDALGLSTVHTNRTLQQLRRDRLIESHGQHVHLLDVPALAKIGEYRLPQRLKAAH
jgi:CRP-like cAMP-binding protein